VVVSLDSLDKDALIRILTEPKNAIVKQYQKFLQLDRVELVFTNDALAAAAEGALKQRTGARGLRTIIEDVLLDVMYEIPSRADVKKVIINGDVITARNKPLLITRGERNTAYPEDESA
jgi:ATP-dependent Clp protease ATP-binding subunit ClpX